MKGKMDWDKIKLDPYEQEIEDNIERAKRVENFEEWKAFVERQPPKQSSGWRAGKSAL